MAEESEARRSRGAPLGGLSLYTYLAQGNAERERRSGVPTVMCSCRDRHICDSGRLNHARAHPSQTPRASTTLGHLSISGRRPTVWAET